MVVQPFSLEGLTRLDYGWTLLSNFLTIKWFDGEQVFDVTDKIEFRDNSDTENSDIDDTDEERDIDSEI